MLKKDTLRYLPSTIIPVILGLIVVPIYTNIFSPEQYGNYALFLTIYSVIQSLSSSWIGSSIIRFNEKFTKENKFESFFSTTTIISGLICLTLSTLFLFLVLIFQVKPQIFLILIAWLPLFAILSTQLEINLQFFRARRQIKLYNTFFILKSVIAPFLILVFYKFFKNEISFIIGTIVANLVALIFIFRNNIDTKNFKIKFYDKKIMKRIFLFGIPLAPTFFASKSVELTERAFITYFEGSDQLGIYAAAQIFSKNPINLIIAIITISSAPIIVKIWENEEKNRLEFFLNNLLKNYIIIGIPISIILFSYSKEILNIFVESKYINGYVVMPYIYLGGFVLGLQWISQRPLILAEKTNTILIGFILSLLSTIFLGYLLVQEFGILGIAISNIISAFFVFIFIHYKSSNYLKISLKFENIIKIGLSSIAMVVINFLIIKFSGFTNFLLLIIGSILSTTIYFLILEFFNEINIKKLITN